MAPAVGSSSMQEYQFLLFVLRFWYSQIWVKRIVAFVWVYETVPHRRHYHSTHFHSDLAFPFFFFFLVWFWMIGASTKTSRRNGLSVCMVLRAGWNSCVVRNKEQGQDHYCCFVQAAVYSSTTVSSWEVIHSITRWMPQGMPPSNQIHHNRTDSPSSMEAPCVSCLVVSSLIVLVVQVFVIGRDWE